MGSETIVNLRKQLSRMTKMMSKTIVLPVPMGKETKMMKRMMKTMKKRRTRKMLFRYVGYITRCYRLR